MVAWTSDRSDNLSLVLNARQYYVSITDDIHGKVLEALRDGASEDELVNIIDRAKRVQDYLVIQDERLRVDSGTVIYTDENGEDEIVHGTVVDRLLHFVNNGLPVKGLVNFIKKLMENPSFTSAQELYDFLDHRSLPICEDGDFLAYKAVTWDYKDKHSGKFDNRVGKTVREPRRKVDDNRNNGCSNGLHAGTLDYVQGYGYFAADDDGNPTENSDRAIIVKINPKHVVSVPLCTDCQKLRTEEYFVLRDYDGELTYHLATDDGYEYEDDEDDFWADYGDDDDDDDFDDNDMYL